MKCEKKCIYENVYVIFKNANLCNKLWRKDNLWHVLKVAEETLETSQARLANLDPEVFLEDLVRQKSVLQ